MRLQGRAAAAACFIFALVAGQAAADEVADFYAGKTITIVVPFNPGGTNANFAQAIADHMVQYIPGKPAMKLEFMPGGGGLRGQNFVYQSGPRDGTMLVIPQDSVVVAQHLAPEGVQYDAAKFIWLGVAVSTHHVLMVRQDTGVKTVDDLKTKEVFIASSGAGSETDMYPRLANGLLGLKMNVVPGFPGGISESLVAVESGEMQGSVNGWQAWKNRPDLVKLLTPVLVFGEGHVADLPDVPNLLDLLTKPEDQQIARFVSSIGPIGRGLATTPDVPAERVAALRAAFDELLKNQQFLDTMASMNLHVDNAMTGADAEALIQQALSASPETIARARELIAIPE